MKSRLLTIPALAVLAFAAVPALAQYPNQTVQPSTALPPQPIQPATAAHAPTLTPSTETPSAPVALPTIAPPNCLQPEYPGSNASNAKIIAFNQNYKVYGDCIKKYVDGNRAWVNAVIEVNNKAVEEYNKYTTDLKKVLDAEK